MRFTSYITVLERIIRRSISLPRKMQRRQRCGSSQIAKKRALLLLDTIIMG